jgi:cholera toxin transcriptional activator
MSSPESRVFRFGAFEADPSSGELRKSGVRVRLQGQPFQVLMLLLERPGELVSRDDIRRKLWPADTFVDFDHSLNTTINKIREALNDSAASPRFVETLAKRGYRFLAHVDFGALSPSDNRPESDAAQSDGTASFSAISLTRLEDVPTISGAYVRALFVLIQVMYLVFYLVALARVAAVQDVLERMSGGKTWPTAIIILTASIGIPVRLYLLSAASFDVKDLSRKFLRIFPAILFLDELWALSPFLVSQQIGVGLALAGTAVLAYVPFSQRTLLLMRERVGETQNLKSRT